MLINLRLGRLGNHNPVAITLERFCAVAGAKLVARRNYKIKCAVRYVNNRFSECPIKLYLNKLGVAKLNSELIAGLIGERNVFVDLIAVCTELDLSVLS